MKIETLSRLYCAFKALTHNLDVDSNKVSIPIEFCTELR